MYMKRTLVAEHKTTILFRLYSSRFRVNVLNFLLVIALLFSAPLQAQTTRPTDTSYQKVIIERSAKIVTTLGIADVSTFKIVQEQLMDQYFSLNKIHEESKLARAAIKSTTLSKEAADAAIATEDEKKKKSLITLHSSFIAQLQQHLTPEQVEKVKDGMTYRVLPVTWTAYMDMLQHLTQEQKDKMYGWLVEARELAMDEGSSDAKHAVFGKYKGRINNYLSAQGYDMKKEGEEWQKRIAAAKEKKTIN
jgi:hypothetical protein